MRISRKCFVLGRSTGGSWQVLWAGNDVRRAWGAHCRLGGVIVREWSPKPAATSPATTPSATMSPEMSPRGNLERLPQKKSAPRKPRK